MEGIMVLIQGKQCEPKLKRTDYPVRKAAGRRNRQGSRGSGGKNMRKEREKGRERRRTPGVILVTAR